MDCEREKASMQGLDNDTPRKKKKCMAISKSSVSWPERISWNFLPSILATLIC